jgi:hypothetical protein
LNCRLSIPLHHPLGPLNTCTNYPVSYGDSFSDDVTGSANRISSRHVFETRIRIRLQRDTQRLTVEGWSRDLSESGLVEIPLPGSDKQVIPAKIARALGAEYGFQFTALSAEQRTRIRAMLKGNPAIPYGEA